MNNIVTFHYSSMDFINIAWTNWILGDVEE